MGELMGEFSIYHWLIVAVIVLLLFGGRRIPELMKGMGEGIRSFKEGISGKTASGAPTGHILERPSSNSSDSKREA